MTEKLQRFQTTLHFEHTKPAASYHVILLPVCAKSSDAISFAILGNAPCMSVKTGVALEEVEYLVELDDADNRNRKFGFHLLNGREFTAPTFLSVKGDQHPGGFRPGAFYQVDRFTDSGTGGNDVVNNQDLACQGCTYYVAALTMVFFLFTVEGVRAVFAFCSKGHSGSGGQRNALIGRPENNVIIQAAAFQRSSVGFAELQEIIAGVKQARIEKVGAGAAGFQRELSKTEYVPGNGKSNKIVLIVVHGKASGECGSFINV